MRGRREFAQAFMALMSSQPQLAKVGALVLYRTLGPSLPEGLAGAAALWYSAQLAAAAYPEQIRRAGIDDSNAVSLGDALFDAILESGDGVIFTRHTFEEAWDLLRTDDHKIHVNIPVLVEKFRALVDAPVGYTTAEYPFVLAAGERRSNTANTIFRDPDWRKTDRDGALAISPEDAERFGLVDGDRIRVVTPGGAAEPVIAIDDSLRAGHISLPNGFGLDHPDEQGEYRRTGVSPNELTVLEWKDDIAGTPWHKHVPARLEPCISV